MSDDGYLRKAYDLDSQEATDQYYSAWAKSYDDELVSNGYRSPQRCAEALAEFVGANDPVLDIGCGTGLSGVALVEAGFANVSGSDVNPDMLDLARGRNLYQQVLLADPDQPFPFAPSTYAAMNAAGVIGVGAAPPSLLTEALAALAPGGHLSFSYNDHVHEVPEYIDVLNEAVTSGVATQVFAEDGPHIEKLGSRSTVYVLRRS